MNSVLFLFFSRSNVKKYVGLAGVFLCVLTFVFLYFVLFDCFSYSIVSTWSPGWRTSTSFCRLVGGIFFPSTRIVYPCSFRFSFFFFVFLFAPFISLDFFRFSFSFPSFFRVIRMSFTRSPFFVSCCFAFLCLCAWCAYLAATVRARAATFRRQARVSAVDWRLACLNTPGREGRRGKGGKGALISYTAVVVSQ